MRTLTLALVGLLMAVPAGAGAGASAPLNDAFADALDLGSLEAEFFE